MKLDALQIWIAIAGLALVVTATRCAFLFAPARWQPRGLLDRALRVAPLAALVALTVPEVIGPLLSTLAASAPEVPVPSVAVALSMAWDDRRIPAALVLLGAARLGGNGFAGLAAGAAVYLIG